jgi:hypothetical protein
MVANWTFGYTDWEEVWIMMLRYGAASTIIAAYLMTVSSPLWIIYIAVGPSVAVVYFLTMVQWPGPDSNEIAEAYLGAAFYAPLGLLWL